MLGSRREGEGKEVKAGAVEDGRRRAGMLSRGTDPRRRSAEAKKALCPGTTGREGRRTMRGIGKWESRMEVFWGGKKLEFLGGWMGRNSFWTALVKIAITPTY